MIMRPGRRTVALIMAVLVAATGCAAQADTDRLPAASVAGETTLEPAPTQTSPSSTSVPAPATPEWSLLGAYDLRTGTRRIYVQVAAGLNTSEIVQVVDELRAVADADATNDGIAFVEHFLLDDDSMFEALLDELPKTEAGDSSGWPLQYVLDHTVADSRGFFVPDGQGGTDRQYWLCLGASSCSEEARLAVYGA